VTKQGPLLRRLNKIVWRQANEFTRLPHGSIISVVHAPPSPPPRPAPWCAPQQILDFIEKPEVSEQDKSAVSMLNFDGTASNADSMMHGSSAAGLTMSKRAILAATLMKKGASSGIETVASAAGNKSRATTAFIRTGADSVFGLASAAKARAAAAAKHGRDVLGIDQFLTDSESSDHSNGGGNSSNFGNHGNFNSINEDLVTRPRSSSMGGGGNGFSPVPQGNDNAARERRLSFRRGGGSMFDFSGREGSHSPPPQRHRSSSAAAEMGTAMTYYDDDRDLAAVFLGAQEAALAELRRGSITIDEFEQMVGTHRSLLSGQEEVPPPPPPPLPPKQPQPFPPPHITPPPIVTTKPAAVRPAPAAPPSPASPSTTPSTTPPTNVTNPSVTIPKPIPSTVLSGSSTSKPPPSTTPKPSPQPVHPLIGQLNDKVDIKTASGSSTEKPPENKLDAASLANVGKHNIHELVRPVATPAPKSSRPVLKKKSSSIQLLFPPVHDDLSRETSNSSLTSNNSEEDAVSPYSGGSLDSNK
jgi:hypothetical protein